MTFPVPAVRGGSDHPSFEADHRRSDGAGPALPLDQQQALPAVGTQLMLASPWPELGNPRGSTVRLERKGLEMSSSAQAVTL